MCTARSLAFALALLVALSLPACFVDAVELGEEMQGIAVGPIHAGDLDQTTDPKSGRMTVTIEVHDVNEAPVAGAVVSGRFSWESNICGSCVGTDDTSCTTDGAGRCSVRSRRIGMRDSLWFYVLGVSAAGVTYNASENHDPDPDCTDYLWFVQRPFLCSDYPGSCCI